jgi:hypothetical protein
MQRTQEISNSMVLDTATSERELAENGGHITPANPEEVPGEYSSNSPYETTRVSTEATTGGTERSSSATNIIKTPAAATLHGPPKLLGMAYGISTSALNVGLTIIPILAAQVRVYFGSFMEVELFFVILAVMGCVASIILWAVDARHGSLLQKPEIVNNGFEEGLSHSPTQEQAVLETDSILIGSNWLEDNAGVLSTPQGVKSSTSLWEVRMVNNDANGGGSGTDQSING